MARVKNTLVFMDLVPTHLFSVGIPTWPTF